MELDFFRGDGFAHDRDESNRYPYIADEQLVKVVNMAMVLKRPLLIKGPPGCGKTELAWAVSHELGIPLHAWYIKSTTQARDGLYTIDTLRRLQDSQTNNPLAQSLVPYIRFGPLGEALSSSNRSVVLIDEVDKADIDFPNDLLRELDRLEFTVDELDEQDAIAQNFPRTYQAQNAPVVIITSNDEKELPNAFLRRCLFHYIEFPTTDQLNNIVRFHTTELELENGLIESAVDGFDRLRESGSFRKEPGTSELLDWVNILHHWGVPLNALEKATQVTELPHWEVLFKHQSDIQTVSRSQNPESS